MGLKRDVMWEAVLMINWSPRSETTYKFFIRKLGQAKRVSMVNLLTIVFQRSVGKRCISVGNGFFVIHTVAIAICMVCPHGDGPSVSALYAIGRDERK